MMATFLHFVLYRFVSELWQASKTSATEKKDHWKAVIRKIEAAVLCWSNGINVHKPFVARQVYKFQRTLQKRFPLYRKEKVLMAKREIDLGYVDKQVLET